MKLKHKPMPEIIRLELSNACNLNCPQCRHNRPGKNKSEKLIHMTSDEAYIIIDEIAPYKPSVTLNVGNEPLIAKAFTNCMRRVKEKGLSGTFNTNGLSLTKGIAEILVEKKFDSINFSVDALTPQTLKKVRGIDNLNRIIDNILLMIAVRGNESFPRIGVTFVKQQQNQHELVGFLDYWKEHADLIRICSFIEDDKPTIHGMELPERIPCKQLFRDMVIRANGDVSPCVISTVNHDNIVGNVFKDGGVEKVWNGPNMNKLRELHNSQKWDAIRDCHRCQYWLETSEVKEEKRNGFFIRYSSPFTTYYNVIDKMGNWNKKLHDRTGIDPRLRT